MTKRGSLFRKYVVYFVVLVSAALVASAVVGLYFTYQENKVALLALQQEKAAAAASRIEAYVQEIEHQLGWMRLPQIGGSSLEQRRIDFLKLLRQVPAITDLSFIDRTGREQLKVSRLSMDVVGSKEDLSRDPKIAAVKASGTYFSPVYFRKETEPYMTIAVAGASEGAGITVAEVNLKFIWDVISRIKIGAKGLAYVVDASGQLIAHPDISLVLQKLNFSALKQVETARKAKTGDEAQQFAISQNFRGEEVLTAHASIAPLGWHVFVEQPIAEAFAPLYASLLRTGLLLLAGLVLAVAVSAYFAGRMVTPIRAIQAGAAQFATGKLDQHIEVRTGDELEALAAEFNDMAKRLQESYVGLERRVEERTRELSEALEQQTATAEILGVISSSPTDIQPVLDAVAGTAARLCGASDAVIRRVEGDVLRLVSRFGPVPLASDEALPIEPGSVAGQAVLTRRTIHVPDLADAGMEFPHSGWRRSEVRTLLVTPLLREGQPIGTIVVRRTEVRPFSDQQIKLLETFAAQAVIAIENVRLFNETKESLEQQTATAEILRAISGTMTDAQPVFDAIVKSCLRLFQGSRVVLGMIDADRVAVQASASDRDDNPGGVTEWPLDRTSGTGRCVVDSKMIHIPDLEAVANEFPRSRKHAAFTGFRSGLFVPLMREGKAIGALSVVRAEPGEFTEKEKALLETFAGQAVIAIENVRLFNQIQEKSRQLEIANRHKSEFLANMSHELRTPLNAIIGFSEVLQERMFGKMNEKQTEYVKDIHESGRHLLSLINDILDLSKVEAGRMELDLARFHIPSAISNTLTLMRERAKRQFISLNSAVEDEVGEITADERKFKQILLNLLSNAVKFTPQGGKIDVRARRANGMVEIAVSDTGVGIAATDQEAVFEEFRQLGRDYTTKAEGTGLGLALTRKFVELHGGRIWLTSDPGKGSTFTFTLPDSPATRA